MVVCVRRVVYEEESASYRMSRVGCGQMPRRAGKRCVGRIWFNVRGDGDGVV
jgi:hypothetical protein